MRKTILTIRDGECRYAVTADLPHLFCGEVTALDRVYCDEHHEICHAGFGKRSPAQIEEMIYGIETTVFRAKHNLSRIEPGRDSYNPRKESETTLAVDVVVKG